MEMWQTTKLDEAVAEEFFGWVWMAFVDRPMHSNPDYPKSVRVRRFMPPESMASDRWKAFFADHDNARADGTEPLAYCYCSSMGPAMVPHFSGDESATADLEREIRRRGLWPQYRDQLWAQIRKRKRGEDETGIDEERLAAADCRTRCLAALALVGRPTEQP